MAKLKPNQFYIAGQLFTERPILFQTEMAQANLEDRKSQTRREIKDIHPDSKYLEEFTICFSWLEPKEFDKPKEEQIASTYLYSPYGKKGDLLWVREKFETDTDGKVKFYAGNIEVINNTAYRNLTKWKPSIHMPQKAARIWLMIEDISVERIQNITEEDCKAEGAEFMTWYGSRGDRTSYHNGFLYIWLSINGDASWNSNPWVWVVKYRILSKTGRPSDDVILVNYSQVMGKEVMNA